MARFSSLLVVPTLCLLATALGNGIEHLASPTTQLTFHDQLYTTIHANVQRFQGEYFSGKMVGKMEKVGGVVWYRGNFGGTKSSQKTKAKFGFNMNGVCKFMGLNMTYGSKVSGKLSVHGKRVRVRARYTISATGSVYGKALKGTAKGAAVFSAKNKSFYYRERGTARMYIGGKLVTAKFYAKINRKAVSVSVYGMYAGKKFFFKYSFSLNLLPPGFDVNSMMIKRNYGTVYYTVGGKSYTEKFDVKGVQMPKLI